MKGKRLVIVDDPDNKGKYCSVYECPYDGCDSLLIREDRLVVIKKENPGDAIFMVCNGCNGEVSF